MDEISKLLHRERRLTSIQLNWQNVRLGQETKNDNNQPIKFTYQIKYSPCEVS